MTRLNWLLTAMTAVLLSLGALGLGARLAEAGNTAGDALVPVVARTEQVALMAGTGQEGLADQLKDREDEKLRIFGEVEAEIKTIAAFSALAGIQPPAKEVWSAWQQKDASAWLGELQAKAQSSLEAMKKPESGSDKAGTEDEDKLAKNIKDSIENFVALRPQDAAFAVGLNDAGASGATGANQVDFRWVAAGEAAGGQGFWFSADEMEAEPKEWSWVPESGHPGADWLSVTLTCRMPKVAEWLAAQAAGDLQNMDAGYGERVLDGAEEKVIGRATMPAGLQYTDEGIWLKPMALKDRIGAPQAGTKGPQFAGPEQVRKYLNDNSLWQDPEIRKFGFTNNPSSDIQILDHRWREIGAWLTRRVETQAQKNAPKEKAEGFRFRWLLPTDGIKLEVNLPGGTGPSNAGGGA